MKKEIKYLLVGVLVFLVNCLYVDASSLSIWSGASNVVVGQTVTISVKADDLIGKFSIISSNSSVLSGGKSSDWLENNTFSYTFTAKSVGSATITVTAVNVADGDANPFYGSKSVTVNVIAASSGSSSGSSGSSGSSSSSGGTVADKKNYSSDNYLSDLSIEGYSINPRFDKDTLEYKLEVDESVTSINIKAKAKDDKASVSGDGEVNLSSGDNTFEIKVTAENGNEKIYKIVVVVSDQNPIVITIDKNKYTVVKKNNDLIDLLDDYEEGSIKINDFDVISYNNSKTKFTLVILKNKDNKYNYYIYDNGKYTLYEEFVVGSCRIYIKKKDMFDGYKEYSFDFNNKKYTGYKLNKNSDFYLIYGMNITTGKSNYYLFDSKDSTLQRYDEDISKYYLTNNSKYKKYLLVALSIISAIIIVSIIGIIIKISKKKRKNRVKI